MLASRCTYGEAWKWPEPRRRRAQRRPWLCEDEDGDLGHGKGSWRHWEVATGRPRLMARAGAQGEARGHGYFKLAAAGASVNGELARGGTRRATGGINRGRSSPWSYWRGRRGCRGVDGDEFRRRLRGGRRGRR